MGIVGTSHILRSAVAWPAAALLALSAVLMTPSLAFAEGEAPAEESPSEPEPTPEPEPEPEPEPTPEPEPEPEPSYTPPPEASEGVGGWAVVDPETGQVHGVIVGTIDTYNARGGKIGTSYMGCSADCVLRFQTRATADGNVAGWHGSNVRYNESDQTFDIGSSNGSTSTTQKLVPEKTARDAAGMDLSTGFVSRVDTLSTDEVRSRVSQDFVNDSNDSVTVNYLSWGVEGTTFRHSTLVEALTNHESDVESVLELQFPAPISEPVEDPLSIPVESENGEEPAEVVTENPEPESSVDEENPVVQTIRRITETVMEFFRNIAGIGSDAEQLQ